MKKIILFCFICLAVCSCKKETKNDKTMLCNALAARIVNGFYAPTPAPFGDFEALKFFKCDQEKVADFLMEVYREDITHYELLYKARPRDEKNKAAVENAFAREESPLERLVRKFGLNQNGRELIETKEEK